MSDAGKAVFLSYASQDAEAAKRIADALRATGVEVWFDQSELVGGDAWDAKIRKQIGNCALLIPIISANTQARTEGYFRLEWRLADQRTHLMAKGRPFLLPVVIDDTRDAEAQVPDSFTEVQWTRLRPPGFAGQAPEDASVAAFCARVASLLEGKGAAPASERAVQPRDERPVARRFNPVWLFLLIPAAILLLATGGMMLKRYKDAGSAAFAPQSEARQLAQRAAAMSIDKYNSTADDFATAEGLLKRALELEQNDAEIWASSSMLHTNIRTRGFDHAPVRREWARRDAERAVKLAPDSRNALFALGRTQRDSDPAAAEVTFKKLLALNPDHAEAMAQLGWLYDRDGRVEEAIKLFDRVLVLDPAKAPLTHYVRFLLYFHYGRFAEAEQAIRRSVELEPSANSCAGLVMLLLTAKGDTDESIRVLATMPAALRGEPRSVWVEATAQLCHRDPEAVLRALQRLQSDFIQDNWFAGPKAYFAGLAHALAGRGEAARVAWQSALALVDARLKETPDNYDLRLCRGQLLAWLGQTDEARREARLLTEMRAGRRVRIWTDSPVLIYAALGDTEAALPMLENLMATDDKTNVGWPLTPALLRHDPRWDKLRGDPRFQALCAEPATPPSSLSLSPSTLSVADSKSVAVLAFANLSDDKANEYFSDGISEELLNVLAKVPGLKVTARTSSFHFKGKDTPIPEIARQLGVAYVVEGSVRKAGDKVRITAQLIKAADGFHVWSDTFTRDLKDIFAVQDEIAGLIAGNLSLKLGVRSVAATASVNPEAFQLYVQGRQAWNLRTNEGFDLAEQLLNRALAISPDFARAHAALADVAVLRAVVRESIGRYDQRNSPEQAELVARIRRVLALDPELAEAHATLGFTLKYGWDFAGGERELRRAVSLNPNYATGHHWLGGLLLSTGQMDDALTEFKLASELDPLSSRILDNYGSALYAAGRYREALAVENRALALQSNSMQALVGKAWTLLALGRAEEAVVLARQLPDGNSEYKIGILAQAGLKGEAETAFAQLEAKERTHWWMLLALGRREEALVALESSASITTGGATRLFFDPLGDAIRGDPRFAKCLATFGWTEAHARAQAWRAAHPPEKPAANK